MDEFSGIAVPPCSCLRTDGGVVDNTLDYLGIARSTPRFSGVSDKTLNGGPVSV